MTNFCMHIVRCAAALTWFAIAATTFAAAPRVIDEAHAASAGIRKLSGKHFTLFTDLAVASYLEEMPKVVDQAFGQWCDYFHVDPVKYADWRVTGFLMHDKTRFAATGLLPADLPPFLNGYTRESEFWVNDQSSEYYQRHLILHEGTHSFMFTVLGGCGPPWYMEGMAELLATHRWENGKLTLGYFPANAHEVPKLGRVEIVQTEYGAGRAFLLSGVMNFTNSSHLKNEAYGWSWAAAAFLDGNPRSRERFRTLPQFAAGPYFNQNFHELFDKDWPQLSEEWQLFLANMDYGYDFERTRLDFKPGTPIEGVGKATVAADQGWQNTGLVLEAGKSYRFLATGRYQIATEPKIWWCEPDGVSIHYHHGQRLGMLIAAIRPADQERRTTPTPMIRPWTIGHEATLKPTESGTLYLRINESCGELSDNAGTIQVAITTQ